MSLVRAIRVQSGVLLALGAGLFTGVAVGSGAPIHVGAVGLLAVLASLAWVLLDRPWLLYVAGGLLALASLGSIEFPIGLLPKLLLAAGTVLVLTGLEIGDLLRRFDVAELARGAGEQALHATRRRLLSVVALAGMLLAAVVAFPSIGAPGVHPFLKGAVELESAPGVIVLATVVSLLLLGLSRVRRMLAGTSAPSTGSVERAPEDG